MKVPVHNLSGQPVGEAELSDAIFGARWNASLVRQALLAQQANRREPIAHAKTRAEVSGGGRKPWRQKHTGRARHGSIRSPIWRGGGVTHGPRKERVFSQKINRKMRRLALHMALSRKLRDQELTVVDAFASVSLKTKALAAAVGREQSALLVGARDSRSLHRASRNLPRVRALPAQALNVEDVLKYRRVFVEEKALGEIK